MTYIICRYVNSYISNYIKLNTPAADVVLMNMVDVVALDMTEVTASLAVIADVNVTGIITEVFDIPNTIEFKLISSINFE